MHVATHFSMLRKCFLEVEVILLLTLLHFLSAWDDVLKEMSAAPLQAGGKVQYYSGQWKVLWWIILFCSSFFCILWIFKFFRVVEQCFRCDLHLYLVSSRLWKSNRNCSYYTLGKHMRIVIVLSFLSDKKYICNIFLKGKWVAEIGDYLVMESDNIITLISTKGVVNLLKNVMGDWLVLTQFLLWKKFIL